MGLKGLIIGNFVVVSMMGCGMDLWLCFYKKRLLCSIFVLYENGTDCLFSL